MILEEFQNNNFLTIANLESFYNYQTILSKTHGLGQRELLAELTIHGHPKTRKMANNKLRNTIETARELADHYIFAHNIKEQGEI